MQSNTNSSTKSTNNTTINTVKDQTLTHQKQSTQSIFKSITNNVNDNKIKSTGDDIQSWKNDSKP